MYQRVPLTQKCFDQKAEVKTWSHVEQIVEGKSGPHVTHTECGSMNLTTQLRRVGYKNEKEVTVYFGPSENANLTTLKGQIIPSSKKCFSLFFSLVVPFIHLDYFGAC